MNKPHIRIQSGEAHQVVGSKIVFVDANGIETDISSVVSKIEWMHQAGDIAAVKISVLAVHLEAATPEVRWIMSQIRFDGSEEERLS